MGSAIVQTGNRKALLIVSNDPDRRQNLAEQLKLSGYRVTSLASVTDAPPADTDCVILETTNLGSSRFGLIERAASRYCKVPIIVIALDATIDMAIRALKTGATEFIAAPCRFDTLTACIESATAEQDQVRDGPDAPIADGLFDIPQFDSLTSREHQVLRQIANGASSKEAGRRLGISPRTVDVHRSRIMDKLRVRRAVQLVRLVMGVDKLRGQV